MDQNGADVRQGRPRRRAWEVGVLARTGMDRMIALIEDRVLPLARDGAPEGVLFDTLVGPDVQAINALEKADDYTPDDFLIDGRLMLYATESEAQAILAKVQEADFGTILGAPVTIELRDLAALGMVFTDFPPNQ